jgi:uncharacterized protein (TIGR02145 family)
MKKNKITTNKSHSPFRVDISLPFRVGAVLLLLLIFTVGCKKQKEAPLPVAENADTSRFTDPVNLDVYKIVKIGNQWWMAENLKATKYRNGQYIADIQSDSARWADDTTGACCFYDNIFTAPGLLYNWYAIKNVNQLAPVGWHIPSDEEWKTLEQYLGMSATDANSTNWRGTNEADKLKIQSYENWQDLHSDALFSTNESGFTALAGSCRIFNSIFGYPGLGSTGFWWTSTSNSSNNKAWYRYLDYKSSQVFRNYVSKNYGFSVRCVRD